jgi:hypothetical protein
MPIKPTAFATHRATHTYVSGDIFAATHGATYALHRE